VICGIDIVLAPEQHWYRDDTGYFPAISTQRRSEFLSRTTGSSTSLGIAANRYRALALASVLNRQSHVGEWCGYEHHGDRG
jgi:hypothetical protein